MIKLMLLIKTFQFLELFDFSIVNYCKSLKFTYILQKYYHKSLKIQIKLRYIQEIHHVFVLDSILAIAALKYLIASSTLSSFYDK